MKRAELIAAAREAREHAHAPYSGFEVGAAVVTTDGKVWTGCNVENRSFGATICAERAAVAAAVGGGSRELGTVVVVTDTQPPSPPCGICLQVLAEFGDPDLELVLANLQGDLLEHRLEDLLPHPFVFPPVL